MSEDLHEQRQQEIIQATETWAKANATRVYIREFRKSKKALLMADSREEAVNAQERDAYSHPEYVALLDELRVAEEEAEKAKWFLRMQEWKFEAWRTRQANQRAERGRYGA